MDHCKVLYYNTYVDIFEYIYTNQGPWYNIEIIHLLKVMYECEFFNKFLFLSRTYSRHHHKKLTFWFWDTLHFRVVD